MIQIQIFEKSARFELAIVKQNSNLQPFRLWPNCNAPPTNHLCGASFGLDNRELRHKLGNLLLVRQFRRRGERMI